MDASFPVDELAWHFRIPRGTIGRWISEDHIEGRVDPYNRRRKLYPLSAVQKAHDRRRPAA